MSRLRWFYWYDKGWDRIYVLVGIYRPYEGGWRAALFDRPKLELHDLVYLRVGR